MKILIALLTLMSPLRPAQAQPLPCTVLGYPTGAPLADRRLTVILKDGRQISIVGHKHGETKAVLGLGELATDEKSSNVTLLAAARKKLAETGLQLPLRDFREEAAFIRQEILTKQIHFVALENGQELLDLMAKESKAFRTMTLKNFARRGLTEQRLLDDSFLVFAGPTRYLQTIDPRLMASTTVVPAEDDELMQQSLESIDSLVAAKQKIETKLPKGHPLLQLLKDTFSNSITGSASVPGGGYHEYLRQISEKEMRDFLLRASPTQIHTDVADYVYKLRKVMQELDKRDVQAVEKLMRARGSGVYFVGEVHLRSLAAKVAEACAQGQERGQGDPVPPAETAR